MTDDIVDLLNLKVLFPKDDKIDNEFRLCEGKPILSEYSNIVPYLILHYNKKTKQLTHFDSLLLPISEEIAIKMFKNRYYKKKLNEDFKLF